MRHVLSWFWILLLSLMTGGAMAAEKPKPRLKASDPASWRPVPYQAVTPTSGVILADSGLFKPVMENNIIYLLQSFSVNHMLWPFRERAGLKNPPTDDCPQVHFWDLDLKGANAGRFMMGAGNTLRWIEHPELRRRLNTLIDGIEACREPNGYILAYPPAGFLHDEQANYARAWFTHGLIEAGLAGNPKALPLLRGQADWFNHDCPCLPQLIYLKLGLQGHIASTRTYFTPVGKAEDLQVAEKYYVQDWWMDLLAARKDEAIWGYSWKYGLDRSHCYEITGFEAYLDHYRATGDRKYLDAMLGAWDLIHGQWEHVGGSIAICEGKLYPAGSYYLTSKFHTGELCGSVFWIKFNQRLHQLFPAEEKYVNEIEKSIYNVGLAAQAGGKGIRYHALLEGRREKPTVTNTCCEGQGTRLFGSLPEYIYSVAPDGLYVNLYEPSSIRCAVAGTTLSLTLQSKFPFQPQVAIKLTAPAPVAMKLRIRVPAWADGDMPLAVNGRPAAMGKPGTYTTLERTWRDGDTVSFTLPMDFRQKRYTGLDQIKGHKRTAVEYGPILLAFAGPLTSPIPLRIAQDPGQIRKWLTPIPGRPLHFAIAGDGQHACLPYWQLTDQTYTCYPVIEPDAVQGRSDLHGGES